jgi:hypothetical protein
MVTVVADRESDIFAEWARLAAPNFHLITRSMQDRRLVNGETLYAAATRFAFTATRFVALPARHGKREARLAEPTLRFGKVELARPGNTRERDLPESVSLTLIEVVERAPASTVPRSGHPANSAGTASGCAGIEAARGDFQGHGGFSGTIAVDRQNAAARNRLSRHDEHVEQQLDAVFGQ